MNIVVSFIIIFLSCVIGAIAGIGGGVIIKPTLDTFNVFDILTINSVSSWSVFSMSIVSIITQTRKSETKLNKKIALFLAISSMLGGILGSSLFSMMTGSITNQAMVKAIQAIVLSLLLVFVIIYMNTPLKKYCWHVENPLLIMVVGLSLGLFGAFLGIGGGPINVALLMIFFGMSVKGCAIYSIITIFFGQASKLVTMAFSGGFAGMDFTLLLWLIPAAIIGGFVGSKLKVHISEKNTARLFMMSMMIIIVLNAVNIVRAF